MKLFSVLKKPNHLDDFASEDSPGFFACLSNTRAQLKIIQGTARIYIVLFCSLVCWSSVIVGLPIVFQDSPQGLYFAQCLMFYICFCIISNYLLIIFFANKSYFISKHSRNLPFSVSDRTVRSELPRQDESDNAVNFTSHSDWSKCNHCDIDVPPRARHCAVCQTCIIKKDHHCFFVGSCIGFYNQRFFITFCLLGIIGGGWGIYNLGTYLNIKYATLLSFQIYKYFMPYCFLACLLGYITIFDACMVVLFLLHITSTSTALYYFCWHILLIYHGQTSYEYIKKKKIYDDNLWSNMRTVFGPYWLIGFLVPLPFLVNEGDGISWKLKPKTD